ncbi:MAG TPA: hypothetical protein VGV65_09815 [Nocardioides sp.]|nr:hypothetical protein [Nocardioides sp.]
MIEGANPRLFTLPPGPERRARMRELRMPIEPGDFSDDEWREIDAEASGTRDFIEAQFSHC